MDLMDIMDLMDGLYPIVHNIIRSQKRKPPDD